MARAIGSLVCFVGLVWCGISPDLFAEFAWIAFCYCAAAIFTALVCWVIFEAIDFCHWTQEDARKLDGKERV